MLTNSCSAEAEAAVSSVPPTSSSSAVPSPSSRRPLHRSVFGNARPYAYYDDDDLYGTFSGDWDNGGRDGRGDGYDNNGGRRWEQSTAGVCPLGDVGVGGGGGEGDGESGAGRGRGGGTRGRKRRPLTSRLDTHDGNFWDTTVGEGANDGVGPGLEKEMQCSAAAAARDMMTDKDREEKIDYDDDDARGRR